MIKELKNIAKIQTGVFAKPVAKGDTVYLQPKYFDELGRLTTQLEPDLNSIGFSDKHILQLGDVLFAAKGSKNFAVHFNTANIQAAASTSFFVIKIRDEGVLPGFVAWFLNQPHTQQYLKAFARGSSIASISKGVLRDLEITIPSIDKQKLILKIDELRSAEKGLKSRIEELREAQIQQQIFNALK
mgnify:CR=1 FL=1|tara:strand:- start:11215 stop:11772 length:558 start_codon:yes stop_codon:yes gene_type:complete